jgi:exopolyphosphatase/guanosine-5'-triphosphate,3'-diphosphate pyrophosphatase
VKIAAVDIGSNSIHLVVVEANARGAFHLLDREKEMVRLGAETLSEGRLSRRAMERGLETLRRYRQIADSRGVEKVIAVATSAVREAQNADSYLARIGRELRLWPRLISGEQEARLIYRAVAHSVHLADTPSLVVDVGGGSVELVSGRGAEVEWVASEKAGVLRLTERFAHSDPLSSSDETRLLRSIRDSLGPHLERARQGPSARVVGTSGTILALGALAHEIETGRLPEALHHVSVKADSFRALRRRLVAMSLAQRLKLPGLDATRADIIVAGAVLVDEILAAVGAREVTLCEWALREGVLLDYIQSHRRSLARAARYPDPRRRSVVQLADRCAHDETHARHTAALALTLFDATRDRHRLDAAERELLEYAALLHDVAITSRIRRITNTPTTSSRTATCTASIPSRWRCWPAPRVTTAGAGRAARTPDTARCRSGRAGSCASWPGCCGWPTPSIGAIARWSSRSRCPRRGARCASARRRVPIASWRCGAPAAASDCSRACSARR